MNEYYYESGNSKGFIRRETDKKAIDYFKFWGTIVLKKKVNNEWVVIHKSKRKR